MPCPDVVGSSLTASGSSRTGGGSGSSWTQPESSRARVVNLSVKQAALGPDRVRGVLYKKHPGTAADVCYSKIRRSCPPPSPPPGAGRQGFDVVVCRQDPGLLRKEGERSRARSSSILGIEAATFLPQFESKPTSGGGGVATLAIM